MGDRHNRIDAVESHGGIVPAESILGGSGVVDGGSAAFARTVGGISVELVVGKESVLESGGSFPEIDHADGERLVREQACGIRRSDADAVETLRLEVEIAGGPESVARDVE